MNFKTIAGFALVLTAGLAMGWFGHQTRSSNSPIHSGTHAGHTNSSGRTVAFYQSSMHPWIKSPNPGRCTICGMELVPVYEGDAGFTTEPGIVALNSNSITALGVRTEPVLRGNVRRSLRFAGVIDDDDSRHRILSAYVEGRIDQLQVHYTGAEVTAGQPLASFYSPMLLTAVREYLTLKDAHPSHASITAATQRLRQLGLADSQINQLKSSFNETNTLVEIQAPMTGTVVKRMVYAGQYVREGEPLFELGDFSTMWFKFDAYERDLAWIQPGQLVEIQTPALPGRRFNASIQFIDPNLDPTSRSAKVRVELPNPLSGGAGESRRQFLHRTYAEARVDVELPNVLVVPRTAVLNPDGQPLVFVERSPGAYARTSVVLGRAGDDAWEVLGGLQEGDAVVTHGNLLLDSQAQLALSTQPTHADSPSPAPKPVSTGASAKSTPAAKSPLIDFLKGVDPLRSALAADDLTAFNKARPALQTAFNVFSGNADHAVWHESLSQLEPLVQLPEARDLISARQSFHAFNTALVDALIKFKAKDPAVASLKIYECPMTDSAFPGAPKNARWFQFSAPLQNPWFGKSMLTCGKEVRP